MTRPVVGEEEPERERDEERCENVDNDVHESFHDEIVRTRALRCPAVGCRAPCIARRDEQHGGF